MGYKFILRLAIVFLATLLSSCTTLSYKEPLEGPRAKVRFVTTSPYFTVLRTFSDEGCLKDENEWMKIRVGPIIGNEPKVLGIPLNEYDLNSFKEVYVSADRKINGLFTSSGRTELYSFTCGVPFYYQFSDGKSYEVKFTVSALKCDVVISELTNSNSGWDLSSVAVFTNIANERNRNCISKLPVFY